LVAKRSKPRRLLGEAIRRHRQRARLTQETLAEKAELSVVFISEIECGKKTISVDSLHRIARALKTRLARLVAEIE
jgi:transcriptional regulator with XRE-family HTH domain